ncbi:MAG: sterol desaturase family protein [Spirochaetes bacterium]|nr:sterol desaturase family protein [Spirochaetota bacterium]MBX3723160.1 sterol desaturase family protein [Turneriella sp.]
MQATGKKSLKEAMATSETIRMFKWDWMEKLSHVHPATPFVIYIPVVSVAMYFAFVQGTMTPLTVLGAFGVGALIWTLIEYLMHRFFFHIPQTNKVFKAIYFYSHGIHHDAPNDATRLVMPPGASIPLAILFFYGFKAWGGVYYLPLFAGFVTAYMVYDFIHFATHFFNWKAAWFRKIKENHMRHHFLTNKYNFGLSSPLWDYVFFTYFRGKASLSDKQPG